MKIEWLVDGFWRNTFLIYNYFDIKNQFNTIFMFDFEVRFFFLFRRLNIFFADFDVLFMGLSGRVLPTILPAV
jgi:hypothetical protein